jgi:hypothetical protein
MSETNKSGEKSKDNANSAIEHSLSVPTFSPSIEYYNFRKEDTPDLHVSTCDIDRVKSPRKASTIGGEIEAMKEGAHAHVAPILHFRRFGAVSRT